VSGDRLKVPCCSFSPPVLVLYIYCCFVGVGVCACACVCVCVGVCVWVGVFSFSSSLLPSLQTQEIQTPCLRSVVGDG
jgi:hypothetical protein